MNSHDDTLVRLDDVVFRRGERAVLDGLSLSIPRGKITAIMGPSGCGKSTLLSLMGGRLLPARGTVRVDGLDVPRLSTPDLYRLRRRMGMLFQSGALLADLTTFENVAFPLREHARLPEPVLERLVLMKLEAVGLRGARHLLPAELSGGMARRVALARAIVLEPMMVMYDEPFTGLDPISMGVIAKLIRDLNDALGITSIIVSHDVAETCEIADHAALMGEGRIVAEGAPQTLLASPDPFVHQFMKGEPDGPVRYQHPTPRSFEADMLRPMGVRDGA